MERKAHQKFSPVEVVLRKQRLPHARRDLRALLQKMASLVNLGEKNAQGDIVDHLPFDAYEVRRLLIDPHRAPHSGVYKGHARSGFKARIRVDMVFQRGAPATIFASDKRKHK